MANTFIPLSNNGSAPFVNLGPSPLLPKWTSVTAPVPLQITEQMIPINPLPGSTQISYPV